MIEAPQAKRRRRRPVAIIGAATIASIERATEGRRRPQCDARSPTTKQAAPSPTTKEAARSPKTKEAAASPTTKEAAPSPTTKEAAPSPTTREASNSGVVAESRNEAPKENCRASGSVVHIIDDSIEENGTVEEGIAEMEGESSEQEEEEVVHFRPRASNLAGSSEEETGSPEVPRKDGAFLDSDDSRGPSPKRRRIGRIRLFKVPSATTEEAARCRSVEDSEENRIVDIEETASEEEDDVRVHRRNRTRPSQGEDAARDSGAEDEGRGRSPAGRHHRRLFKTAAAAERTKVWGEVSSPKRPTTSDADADASDCGLFSSSDDDDGIDLYASSQVLGWSDGPSSSSMDDEDDDDDAFIDDDSEPDADGSEEEGSAFLSDDSASRTSQPLLSHAALDYRRERSLWPSDAVAAFRSLRAPPPRRAFVAWLEDAALLALFLLRRPRFSSGGAARNTLRKLCEDPPAGARSIERRLCTLRESEVASMAWPPEFYAALARRPILRSMGECGGGVRRTCDACQKHGTVYGVELAGPEYEAEALYEFGWVRKEKFLARMEDLAGGAEGRQEDVEHRKSSLPEFQDDGCVMFQLGSFCAKRVKLYHQLLHYKFHIFHKLWTRLEGPSILNTNAGHFDSDGPQNTKEGQTLKTHDSKHVAKSFAKGSGTLQKEAGEEQEENIIGKQPMSEIDTDKATNESDGSEEGPSSTRAMMIEDSDNVTNESESEGTNESGSEGGKFMTHARLLSAFSKMKGKVINKRFVQQEFAKFQSMDYSVKDLFGHRK